MKKVLLMNNSLTTGGVAASMINAANELSKEYDVTIFCNIPDGELKDRISDKVHILDSTWRLRAMNSSLFGSMNIGVRAFLWKIFSRLWSIAINNKFPIAYAQKFLPHLGFYDVACSYRHEAEKGSEYTGLIRILINKVSSPVKLSWVHCDYNIQKISGFNDQYYNQIDGIVGVSKSVADAFVHTHPNVHTKIYTCKNMIDYDSIYKLSQTEPNIKFNDNGIICFSACRLSWVKGIERMIDCTHDLFAKNNVYWYIAGDGPSKNSIESTIEKYHLNKRIILLGNQENPFAYMRYSDLYLSVSYEEAAPLVYQEAKALHLPIFSTRTLSTEEMLDEKIDFICDNTSEHIRRAFYDATVDKKRLSERKVRLSSYIGSNNESLEQFKRWIELSSKKSLSI